ncbi:hypothetical protein AOQ84DRAFT_390221 [Glonium stellatum]|uniref:NACHT domain-containing protein n=1 Tax=Glonium stellatum TaxID=574774 RepID=A0A8E2EWV2_9PEZI|nr:hypothetical protein AOQ84DRAFT_390221 [Glonium stellatum]
MDPLSALGLAGNIVQFVDFSCKIVTAGSDIYNSASGMTAKHEQLEKATQRLYDLTRNLDESRKHIVASRRLTPADTAQGVILQDCQNIASELLAALSSLKSQGRLGKLESLRQALINLWSQGRIEEMDKRLERLRQLLVTNILISMQEQVEEVSADRIAKDKLLRSMHGINKGLGETFLDHVQESRRWRAELITAFRQGNWRSQPRDGVNHAPVQPIAVAETERARELRKSILRRLQFHGMDDRHLRISDAHKKTFEWIYDPPSTNAKPWANFKQWLECESNFYWVTGKPGAGKSTLVKHIYKDQRTFQSLEVWSADLPLITGAFFFWISGTAMQCSRSGLLRSLLHQILKKCPVLISHIFPTRWDIDYLFGEEQDPFSWPELLTALRLLPQVVEGRARLCLFIDGLDEFDGDHAELLENMSVLKNCPHIKVCVSSRPWNVFEDAFAQGPSLRVQELTLTDMMLFINNNFYDNAQFLDLEKREPEYAKKLLQEVATKASGVFLWVRLVVHSLLDGMKNGDRVLDLQRRLDLLPADIKELYQRMFDSIDPFYFEHASQLFQIIRAADEPPSLLCMSLADEDPDFVFRAENKALAEDEISSRFDNMKRRLNSRCKGLLEVGSSPQGVSDDQLALRANTSQSGVPVPEDALTVQYLHRTVRDFLYQDVVWVQLLRASNSFDPYLSLCRSYILQIKTSNPKSMPKNRISVLVTICFLYASKLHKSSRKAVVPLFDELERALTNLPKCGGQTYTYIHFSQSGIAAGYHIVTHTDCDMQMTMMSFAILFGLDSYVQIQLDRGYLAKANARHRSPLLDVFSLGNAAHIWNGGVRRILDAHQPSPSLSSLELLFKYGANPNQKMSKNCTVWTYLINLTFYFAGPVIGGWLDIIDLFVHHGADPMVEDCRKLLSRDCLFPERLNKLRSLLRKRRWQVRLRVYSCPLSAESVLIDFDGIPILPQIIGLLENHFPVNLRGYPRP